MTDQKKRTLYKGIFALYGLVMLYLMLLRGRGPVDGIPYWEQVKHNLNLIPYHTNRGFVWVLLHGTDPAQRHHAAVNIGGNIVMFLPLGFLLPAAFRRLRKLLTTLVTGAGLVVLVELTQLFSLRGSCDIDDLLLNLVGIGLGWSFWRLIKR